ncbi:hypothetical protein ACFVZH_38155 [Streptomyces sp. NPDC059534]|uniref:hypothetical protein n=1 Tax=Streptomyces sp. NPDC059534 TaxID=3346859 RepID=UPI003698569A
MGALAHRLNQVLPQGIRPLGIQQTEADRPARLRQVVGLPAAANDTPGRARFTTGIAFGVWGLADEDVERLTCLAGELTDHVAAWTVSERVLVVSDYADGRATISVIALQGYARGDLDPRGLSHVEVLDETGTVQYGMGPSAYVQVRVMRP